MTDDPAIPPPWPDGDILARFGVQVVAPLGGRLNLHWLVERRHERLVLRRSTQPPDEIAYELRVLDHLAAMGWPVAPALAGPIAHAGCIWTLARFLPGDPPAAGSPAEQRDRGRLLARLHADLATLQGLGQRGRWRRCEEILGDATLDGLLDAHQRERPEEIPILRWHLHRARERVAGLRLHRRPGIVVHGDFAPWNLRVQDGRLSGILDFELAHWDHRIGDFALSWRGVYDEVVHGYAEVSPLEPEEWALLTPLWWASLIAGACHDLRHGVRDDGWTIRKLLVRSPLMGDDSVPYGR